MNESTKKRKRSSKDSGKVEQSYPPRSVKKVQVETCNSSECIKTVRDFLNPQRGSTEANAVGEVVIEHKGEESVEDLINLLFEVVPMKPGMEKIQKLVSSCSPSQTAVQDVPGRKDAVASTSAAAKNAADAPKGSTPHKEIIYQALVHKLSEVEGFETESWGPKVNVTTVPFFPKEVLTEEEQMDILNILEDDAEVKTTETEATQNQQRGQQGALENKDEDGVTGELKPVKKDTSAQVETVPATVVKKTSSNINAGDSSKNSKTVKNESGYESVKFVEERARLPVASKNSENSSVADELARKLREKLDEFKRNRAKKSIPTVTVQLNNTVQQDNKKNLQIEKEIQDKKKKTKYQYAPVSNAVASDANASKPVTVMPNKTAQDDKAKLKSAKEFQDKKKAVVTKNSELRPVPQGSKTSPSDENSIPSAKKKSRPIEPTNDELIHMMEAEVKKESPSITLLSRWMRKTFDRRKEEFENPAIALTTILDKYPALTFYKILKEEFGRVCGDIRKMERLEYELQNEFKRVRKRTLKKTGNLDPLLEKARKKWEDNTGDSKMEKVLGMICLSFQLAEDDVRSCLCRMWSKKGNKPNASDLITPAMHTQESQIFELNTSMEIYVDGSRYLLVPNFYEGVLCLYSIFWLHSIAYPSQLVGLFEYFDVLVGNPQSSYDGNFEQLL